MEKHTETREASNEKLAFVLVTVMSVVRVTAEKL